MLVSVEQQAMSRRLIKFRDRPISNILPVFVNWITASPEKQTEDIVNILIDLSAIVWRWLFPGKDEQAFSLIVNTKPLVRPNMTPPPLVQLLYSLERDNFQREEKNSSGSLIKYIGHRGKAFASLFRCALLRRRRRRRCRGGVRLWSVAARRTGSTRYRRGQGRQIDSDR